MQVIYKYSIKPGGSTTLRGYFSAFMDAQEQDGNLVLWAAVEPYEEKNGRMVPRNDLPDEVFITCLGTGWPYESTNIGQYFRTVQTSDGLVWHIFIDWPEDKT